MVAVGVGVQFRHASLRSCRTLPTATFSSRLRFLSVADEFAAPTDGVGRHEYSGCCRCSWSCGWPAVQAKQQTVGPSTCAAPLLFLPHMTPPHPWGRRGSACARIHPPFSRVELFSCTGVGSTTRCSPHRIARGTGNCMRKATHRWGRCQPPAVNNKRAETGSSLDISGHAVQQENRPRTPLLTFPAQRGLPAQGSSADGGLEHASRDHSRAQRGLPQRGSSADGGLNMRHPNWSQGTWADSM